MASESQARQGAANRGEIEGATRGARRAGATTAILCIAIAAFVVLSAVPRVASASGSATIWTDASDYTWYSTVHIFGSGFAGSSPVSVSVVDPNGNTTGWSVTSDPNGSFETTYVLGSVPGNYTVTASDGTDTATTTFHDASEAANLDQCTNGPVQKGVVTPQPCLIGTVGGGIFAGQKFSNWVNGNSNGAKSHWQEGEFISYRVDITGLSAGSHNLQFEYQTIHGSVHAIDYIGSFDYTETTALASVAFHYNFNNPCVDLLGAANCPQSTPPTPTSTVAVLAPILANCAGSSGTVPTPISGSIKAFAPSGTTTLTGMSYTFQNKVSGTGQCSTGVRVDFTTTSGTSEVVLTWGGHIASASDWGPGNDAGNISGSPYHMSLDSLDGASTGAQDRALSTTAIFFAPTISTVIKNAANGQTVPGTPPTLPQGSSVYDTATLTGAYDFAGGTVYYRFYGTIGCTGTAISNNSVSVTNAIVPNSPTKSSLAAGSYSFSAFYTGDSLDLPAVSACEPLVITSITPTLTTTISPAGPYALGAVVHDTAALSGLTSGTDATGTVTYTLSSGTCGGSVVWTQTVTIGAGSAIPDSQSTAALGAGSWAFQASYSGDSHYNPTTSACEPLSVGKASPTLSTTIVPASPVALGTMVHDTASFGGLTSGFAATGTVTYTFYSGTCGGTVIFTQTVTIGANSVIPDSQNTAALAAGSYAFQAVYGGDSNYNGATSGCEPLTVAKASLTLSTTIVPASPVALGTMVHDTASFSGLTSGFDATGTVTYTFFGGDCSGGIIFTQAVTIGAGSSIPDSQNTAALAAGSYAFQAVYGGDSNYNGATSSCEPLTVSKGSPTLTTTISPGGPYSLGAVVHDTALFSGLTSGFAATGTVTYKFYGGDCSGTLIFTQVVTIGPNSAIPDSQNTAVLAAGSYAFSAAYSGDGNYNAATATCEPMSVNKASLSLSTTIVPASPVALGTIVHDTASFGGLTSGFAATGTVTYTFYSGTCGGTVVFTQTVTIGANSVIPDSQNTAALAAGSYAFEAVYGGDSNYSGAASSCESLTVNKASLSLSTTIVPASPVALGTIVHDTASFGGLTSGFDATGTVTYTFYSGTCGGAVVFTQPVTIGAGSSIPISQDTAALAAGSYAFEAVYGGDSNYNGVTSDCEPLTVTKASPTLSTTIVPASPVALGTAVHDTASFGSLTSGFAATGTVTYTFFSGTCGGTVVFTQTVTIGANSVIPDSQSTAALAAGSYAFEASYPGDSNYNGITSGCEPLTVNQASTTTATALFTSTGSPISLGGSVPLGTSVYDTATTGPATPGFPITGTVTYAFFPNGACTGSPTSTFPVAVGGASPTVGPLAAGHYSFQATYSGDANHVGSTSDCEPFTVLAKVVLVKDTVGGEGTFAFGATGTSLAGQFPATLTTSGGTASQTFNNVDPDNAYTITETVPTGWVLTALSCTAGTADVPPILAGGTGTVSFTIPASGLVTCTFTNTAEGKIVIVKNTFGGTGTFTFTLTGSVSESSSITTSGTPGTGTTSFPNLEPTFLLGDNYKVTETPVPGWSLMSASCVGADGRVMSPGSITLLAGETVVCTFNNVMKSIVSDSALCTFDTDSGLAGSQFRLLFTPDPASPGLFKSTASNPGQFYYNIFVVGTGTIDLTISLPYPFVTQGAQPIHAYDSATFTTVGGQICITPGNEVFHDSTQVTLASYKTGNFGTFASVHIVFPWTGFVYINIHVDYGTKGFGGWQKQPNVLTGGNDAVNVNLTSPFYGLTIVDQGSYAFSYSLMGDGSDTQSVQNENVFKKDPGFAGQVIWNDSNGGSHGVSGVLVNVYWPNGGLVGSGVTDSDGFWMVAYKYTGKALTFMVCLPAYPGVPCQYVTMKSNGFVYVPPFVVPQPPGAQP